MNVQDVHSRSGGHSVDVAWGNFKESRILSLNIVHGSVLQIFRKESFFYGHDNHDQPVKIAKVLGTDGLNAYLKKYHIELDPHLEHLVGRHNRKPWSKFINADKRRQAAWM